MSSALQHLSRGQLSQMPPLLVGGAIEDVSSVEAELARHLPHIRRMSKQLKSTSQQIETSVVEVCNNFQGIAERARSTTDRTRGFLSSEHEGPATRQSFGGLIRNCGETLVKILTTTEQAGEVSRRAIERIQQMDKSSEMISAALEKLERIAHENKMLAMNARIEAAHAGVLGAGFAVVAVEVVAQTERAQEVTNQVSDLIANLRSLAATTAQDLQRMNEQDSLRLNQCKSEVEESLRDMESAHGEMETMLAGMTEEGALLANDIGSAVRGLQFQDRTSQQLAHVVEDLDTLQAKLTTRFGDVTGEQAASHDGFSGFTMKEEREVAGMDDEESGAGDVELF
jgi:methyl-accepting chemotaxis protein